MCLRRLLKSGMWFRVRQEGERDGKEGFFLLIRWVWLKSV